MGLYFFTRKNKFVLPFAIEDEQFRSFYREYLSQNYHSKFEIESLGGGFDHDVNEHTYRRTRRFHDCLVPWLSAVFNMNGATALEVGSGTGSSTLAFSPYVKKIHCFEIEKKATLAAQTKLDYFKVENVKFEDELFGPDCSFVKSGNSADIVFLVAVLEHTTFKEFETILKTAYETLRPGGVILIAETPNRLTPTDYHSSFLYFYQWLPPEIRERYFHKSPRQHFRNDLSAVEPETVRDRLTRWGNGVSFHDFELALGDDIHSKIIADGWEQAVRPLAPIFQDDEILLDMFKRFEIPANKAFARSWLYFIIQKPN